MNSTATIGIGLRGLVLIAAGYALIGGVLSFLGWVLDVPRLSDWDGSGIVIKPNTALCIIAAALALMLAQVRPTLLATRRLLGIFTAVIGGLTLFQHLTGADLRIDTLLFDEPPGAAATVAPGRMGPPASTCFVLLGTALLLCGGGTRARRWGASLGLIAVAIASLALVGYLFGAGQLYEIPRLTGIAMQTASMIFALGIGIILIVPERGVALVLQRPDAGGLVLRRLILPVILLPIVFGWLRLRGQGAGLYDTAFGTALQTIAEIALLVAILWWTARSLSLTDTALAREREQQRVLSRRLLEVQETERRKIARDLHDELGQVLTAVKINLQTVQPASSGPLAPSVALVDRALQQTRSLSLALRPPLLDDLGLMPALRWLVDAQARQAGCRITLAAEPLPHRPSPAVETACFRIVQEAVTNAQRHARANLIAVELRLVGDELQLTVRDDGTGFDLVAARTRALRGGSLGVLGMEERANLAGGRMGWDSAAGRGTTVQATFPLSPALAGDKDPSA